MHGSSPISVSAGSLYAPRMQDLLVVRSTATYHSGLFLGRSLICPSKQSMHALQSQLEPSTPLDMEKANWSPIICSFVKVTWMEIQVLVVLMVFVSTKKLMSWEITTESRQMMSFKELLQIFGSTKNMLYSKHFSYSRSCKFLRPWRLVQ
jgi:hypothetical protein